MDILKPFLKIFKNIAAVIEIVRALYTQYSAFLERAKAAPGFPVPNPTSSFWQDDPPFPELVDIQSPRLPEEADIVIIGSGIAGAAVARTILHELLRNGDFGGSNSKKVVVLEARQLCGGATGRNGGHIKASPHEQFERLSKEMPKERAAALCRFQLRHLDVLTGLTRAEGMDIAECREVETVDFAVDEKTMARMQTAAEEVNKWMPECKMQIWTGPEARKKFAVNDHVVGAVSYQAGALWPYRFVTSIWRKLLDEFPETLRIETGTTAQTIAVAKISSQYPYETTTSRGIIRTRHVVHATNAFASQLVPGLRGKTTSALAHMTAQLPGKDFPDLNGSRSWSVIFGGSAFDYITQRPSTNGQPGEVMVGGGLFQSAKQGMDAIGVYDDSKMDSLPLMHLGGLMTTIFAPNWGDDGDGGRMKKAWSGIIGITSDILPLVGRLDPRLTGRKVGQSSQLKSAPNAPDCGEWLAAFFCGDGMVWAWLCGTALGLMVIGSEHEDLPEVPGRPGGRLADWFPPELYATLDRVKNMDIADLADDLM